MSIKTNDNITYLDIGQNKKRKFTQHASKRSSQRGISAEAVDYLLDHGSAKYDGRGGVVHYLSRQERKYMHEFDRQGYKKLAKCRSLYVVTSSTSGEIITVGHRYRRIFN